MGWKFKDDFDEIKRQLAEAMQHVAQETGEEVLKTAQDKAPVQTGALRDSARLESPAELLPGYSVRRVNFNEDYASYVEEGFYHKTAFAADGGTHDDGTPKRGRLIAGRWFLRDAMQAREEAFTQRTIKELRKLGIIVHPT